MSKAAMDSADIRITFCSFYRFVHVKGAGYSDMQQIDA